MKQKYIDAVAEHNLVKVRMMLADELLLDPRGTTFSDMLAYAKVNITDLFEPNEESSYTISPDKSTWTMDLVSMVKQDLISNFSIEKLALFHEVAMEVGKNKAKVLAEEEKRERKGETRTSSGGNSSSENRNVTVCSNRQRNNRNEAPNKRTLGTISLCGGAALTIVGLCVEGCIAKTLLCLVGGAAVVVGGIVLLSKDDNKR